MLARGNRFHIILAYVITIPSSRFFSVPLSCPSRWSPAGEEANSALHISMGVHELTRDVKILYHTLNVAVADVACDLARQRHSCSSPSRSLATHRAGAI